MSIRQLCLSHPLPEIERGVEEELNASKKFEEIRLWEIFVRKSNLEAVDLNVLHLGKFWKCYEVHDLCLPRILISWNVCVWLNSLYDHQAGSGESTLQKWRGRKYLPTFHEHKHDYQHTTAKYFVRIKS